MENIKKNILFISDLDGTLLNEKGVISNYTKQVLNQMIEKGLRFTVATGRSPATALYLLREIPLKFPVSLLNGVVEWEPEQKIFRCEGNWDRSTIEKIRKDAEKVGIEAFWFHLEKQQVLLQHDKPLTEAESSFFNHGFEDISSIGKSGSFETLPIPYAMFISKKREKLAWLKKRLEESPKIQTDLLQDLQNPELWCLDVFDKVCDKGVAAEKLRIRTNSDCLVGFGDAWNDYELFEHCDIRCAMGNAPQRLKEKADYVLEKNTEDGVVKFLQFFWENV